MTEPPALIIGRGNGEASRSDLAYGRDRVKVARRSPPAALSGTIERPAKPPTWAPSMNAVVRPAGRRSAARRAPLHSPRARDAMNTVSYGKSQGWIGASVRRKEDGRLLTGQGR